MRGLGWVNAGRVGPGGVAAQHQGGPVGPGSDHCPGAQAYTSLREPRAILASLPDQWRRDEAHFPRERNMAAPRTWRTREDPFAGVWGEVPGWLQEDPDASAVALLGGCSPPIPAATARHTYVPCSGGCSSGAASWPKNWFIARPMRLSRIRAQCQN